MGSTRNLSSRGVAAVRVRNVVRDRARHRHRTRADRRDRATGISPPAPRAAASTADAGAVSRRPPSGRVARLRGPPQRARRGHRGGSGAGAARARAPDVGARPDIARRALWRSSGPRLPARRPPGYGTRRRRLSARLQGIERELAIKVFRSEIADEPAFVHAFVATAQLVAALRHPAVVPIQDYWREPGAPTP